MFDSFGTIQKELEKRQIEIISSEFQRVPKQYKYLKKDDIIAVENLMEAIEEDDDVQNIYHNMELSQE